ncbi:LigA protein [Micromonospora sp. M42]|nr:LigA protein [Micromonospora sp. M42]
MDEREQFRRGGNRAGRARGRGGPLRGADPVPSIHACRLRPRARDAGRRRAAMACVSTCRGLSVRLAPLDCGERCPECRLACGRRTLLFFLDQEGAQDVCGIENEKAYARVVYVPAGAETVDGVDVLPAGTDLGRFLAPEHEMYAGLQAELPDWLDRSEEWLCDTQIKLLRDLPHRKEMGALLEQLWPERDGWIQHDVFVGGYTISAQDPPETFMTDRERMQQASSLPRAERLVAQYEEEQRVVREWVPLAQFGVPDEEYVNARFLIRHDDLAAGRFDGVLSFCEFTE